VVNEDPNAKLIRELKEELLDLRSKLGVYDPAQAGSDLKTPDTVVTIVDLHGNSRTLTKEQLQDEVQASEKIMAELNETWEEKLRKTQEIQLERERTLEELGISVEKGHIGVHTPKKMPHLVNLNEDPLMSECLVYQLKPGKTQVGRLESSLPADIRLSGSNIHDEHCYFENNNSNVTLYPGKSSMTMVNGLRINKPKRLRSGFRVILGDYHVFRFNHPEEVRRERDLQLQSTPTTTSRVSSPTTKTHPQAQTRHSNSMEDDRPEDRPDSPISSASVMSEFVDWNYARKEAVINAHMLSETNINQLKDQDLDVLFDNIAKIRYLRKSVRSESFGGSNFDDDSESKSSRLSMIERLNGGESGVFGSGSSGIWEDNKQDSTAQSPLETSALALKEKLRVAEEEVQQMNQERKEYEAKIENLSAAEAKSDELLAERALMEERLQQAKAELSAKLEEQREQYEEKMKRMSLASVSSQRLDSKVLKSDPRLLLPLYSDFELELIYKTLTRWKSHRKIHMAETVLTNAVLLKEANIISRELCKQIVYQFTVVEAGQFANPTSSWESTSGLDQFNQDEDSSLQTLQRPCIAIKVIDHKNGSIYIWSLERLKVRLHRMRNLYNFVDRPQYRKHFNMEDPFYESPEPQFSFIGSASTSLNSLVRMQFQENVVPVLCRTTGKSLGQARIGLIPLSHNGAKSPAALSSSVGSSFGRLGGYGRSDEEDDVEAVLTGDQVKVGDQLLFEITLLSVEGLSEEQYTQVHAQFRLSNFTGPQDPPLQTSSAISSKSAIPQDKVFVTEPVSGFENEPIFFGFSQTLSMVVTAPMLEVLTHGSLHFEFFGEVTAATLEGWEKWDLDLENSQQLEQSVLPSGKGKQNGTISSTKNESGMIGRQARRGKIGGVSSSSLTERRSEDELMMEESHDVLAHIQICELAPSGEYVPVQVISNSTVDIGAFTIRQGLQRRVVLTLSHSSGRQFPWSRVSSLHMGRIRLLDNKGRITESPPRGDVLLNLVPGGQKVEYPTDGTSVLTVHASWDSTLHESLFLNRITEPNARVLLTLTWLVEAERCMDPVCFRMDIAAQIQDRSGASASSSSSSGNSYRSLMSMPLMFLQQPASRNKRLVLKKASGLFLLNLKPVVIKKASELWRMNTASKYVRGEEFLEGVWKPRGVSLVNDFKAVRNRIQRREAVERTRQWLQTHYSHGRNNFHVGQQTVERTVSSFADGYSLDASEGSTEVDDGTYDQRTRTLLRRVIKLWKFKPVQIEEVAISQNPPSLDTDDPEVLKQPRPSPRLQSEVKLVTKR